LDIDISMNQSPSFAALSSASGSRYREAGIGELGRRAEEG
jgi:hypothetical protein